MKMQTSERSDSHLTFLYVFDKCMKKSRCFGVGVLFGWGGGGVTKLRA